MQVREGFWPSFKARFIGDRNFYKTVLMLIVPIIIQNTVSNVVNLLDNVMVGALGTVHMSGVAIGNQLIFVFNLVIFGGMAGAGIYGAQFAGAEDWKGFRQSFRFKLLVAIVISIVGILVLFYGAENFISAYLQGEGKATDAQAMLFWGREYLLVMLFGLLPFALTQCYSGALREAGETFLPMVSSLAAVFTNLIFNYLLIFGKWGFPVWGVRGAAVATVISRFVELAIVAYFSHTNVAKFPFLVGLYRRFSVDIALAKTIAVKGMPLLLNEFLWSTGMITITRIYSAKGLAVVAGLNIASTVTNLFNVFFLSMGTAVAVMTGQALGAGNIKLAKEQIWKFIFFSVSMCLFLGSLLVFSAEYVTRIYNTEAAVRQLAVGFMRTSALFMSFHAITHCCYFAIRSGGKTLFTLLFDSVYVWVVHVPYIYFLVNFTGVAIQKLYPLGFMSDVLKAVISVAFVSTGFWAQNLVASPAPTTD